MKILRFIFPFLFVRNWHTGAWEYSRSRVVLFVAGIVLVGVGLLVAYTLQAPVEYARSSV